MKQMEEIKRVFCWLFSHITQFCFVKNKFKACLEHTVLINNLVIFLILYFAVKNKQNKQTNTHTHTHTYTLRMHFAL